MAVMPCKVASDAHFAGAFLGLDVSELELPLVHQHLAGETNRLQSAQGVSATLGVHIFCD